jgi:OmpA-OmpF porin, OOP family
MKVVFVFILLLSFSVLAQPSLSTKSKKAIEYYTSADNYRVRGQYKQAIGLLQQAIEKDKNFVEAYFRLGQTYKSCRQYALATSSFEAGLLVAKDERVKRSVLFELGESYFLAGSYSGATQALTQYINTEVPSMQNRNKFDAARRMMESAAFATQNEMLSQQYQQRALSDTINCFALQYFPVLTADQQSLIFTRRLGNKDTDDEDIVMSTKDTKGNWTPPVSISQNINSPLNEGTSTISADGRKLIFTSCVGRDGWGSCDLYESIKTGDNWSKPKNLGPLVNSTEWESQPSLSADGRTLYFVSDRKAGFGRRDIWVSTLDVKGNWTRARNIGNEVNTSYDEISPFIHANNATLYYASSGLTGFGGYDIFFTERSREGKWSAPVNMGAPINNHEDQFSFFVTADGAKAYYSHESVTESGQTKSRIYETQVPERTRIKFASNYVKGIVRDKETRIPLKAIIELVNIERDTLEAQTQSDSVTGQYLIVLTSGAKYGLYVNRPGYLFHSLSFDYAESEKEEPVVIDVDLEAIKTGSHTVLNNIFFEFDSYQIQPDSHPELKKVIRFLNDNAGVSIEVLGHTDSKGAEEYNLNLSKNRARSVANYLIDNGVSKNRIFFKGLGSSKPISTNTDEHGQKLNRRIEFKIL